MAAGTMTQERCNSMSSCSNRREQKRMVSGCWRAQPGGLWQTHPEADGNCIGGNSSALTAVLWGVHGLCTVFCSPSESSHALGGAIFCSLFASSHALGGAIFCSMFATSHALGGAIFCSLFASSHALGDAAPCPLPVSSPRPPQVTAFGHCP